MGEGFLGRGQPDPSPPARGSGGALYAPPVRSGAPAAKRFLAFYGHYMAFPGISVASGHVPVAKYFSAIHHVSAYPELL